MKKTGQFVIALIIGLAGGCQTLNEEKVVFEKYYETTLGYSTSADVLESLHNPLDEYLSQGDRVAATWNEADDGQTHWFNMVAFDEEALTAVRKYGFSLVEQRLGPNAPPKPKMRLDGELIAASELLDAVYPTQNARFIAVLGAVKTHFAQDALEVVADSQILQSSALMVNQALNAALVKLQNNPAMAARLPWLEGLEFDHPTLGQSRIRMLILGNTVKVKIKASPAWFRNTPFEQHPDVKYM